ncbi:hypothetical protein H696_03993 [Fonticula alba]|uniref:Peptidase A1 domain-containing protein n=1 Tax=Fonticula alba TaxID=691883 RepID=A0A058Z638_FONAL|nr:hypothetical protein H696_03993 [Fonticula alba]KCV69571.1 hypothetical protein H696_03993 [Fonticula alba]|eukprot:XP_009496136.1 hypothetical protein H696_03993 [Fonticula alba]
MAGRSSLLQAVCLLLALLCLVPTLAVAQINDYTQLYGADDKRTFHLAADFNYRRAGLPADTTLKPDSARAYASMNGGVLDLKIYHPPPTEAITWYLAGPRICQSDSGGWISPDDVACSGRRAPIIAKLGTIPAAGTGIVRASIKLNPHVASYVLNDAVIIYGTTKTHPNGLLLGTLQPVSRWTNDSQSPVIQMLDFVPNRGEFSKPDNSFEKSKSTNSGSGLLLFRGMDVFPNFQLTIQLSHSMSKPTKMIIHCPKFRQTFNLDPKSPFFYQDIRYDDADFYRELLTKDACIFALISSDQVTGELFAFPQMTAEYTSLITQPESDFTFFTLIDVNPVTEQMLVVPRTSLLAEDTSYVAVQLVDPPSKKDDAIVSRDICILFDAENEGLSSDDHLKRYRRCRLDPADAQLLRTGHQLGIYVAPKAGQAAMRRLTSPQVAELSPGTGTSSATGAIIGIAVGAVVLVAIVAVGMFVLAKQGVIGK